MSELPTVEQLKEKLIEEINEWANEQLVGRAAVFSRLVPEIEAMASQKFGQGVRLVNPRMEGTTLCADGFLFERSVKEIYISGHLVIPEKGGETE